MKKQLFFVLVLLLLFAGFLHITGCETETEEVLEEEKEVVEEEKEVVIVLATEPASFCPIIPPQSRAGADMIIHYHVAESLFIVNPDDGSVQPLLAESAESSPDGMTWTINLREGISFHDGASFNAEAAKINLDRIMDGGAVVSGVLNEFIDEIEVVGDYTLKLHMKEPFGGILTNLASRFFGMVSPNSLEGLPEGETYEFPVGTGPYEIVQWVRGDKIVLEKVDDYWGEAAKIDRLIFKPAPEAASRVIMLEAGDADIIRGVPLPEAPRLAQNPDIEVEFYPIGMMFVGLNNSRPPFDDPRVRKALNYAVDSEAIVANVLQGVSRVSVSPVPQGHFGFKDVGIYEYNPEKAKQLLEEAGYGGGLSINFYHPTGRFTMDAMVAEAIQAMLKDVGVEVELITMDNGHPYASHTRAPGRIAA